MLALRDQLGVLRDRRGFTMVEMMVVLIIIAVLIGVGIKFYLGYIENSRVTKAKSQLQTMQAGLDSYYAENNAYPNTKNKLLNAGLKASDMTNPDTIIAAPIDLASTDPWGKNYKYFFNNDVGTAHDKAAVVYTGYDTVQGNANTYVAAESKNGAAVSLEVTSDVTPDGS